MNEKNLIPVLVGMDHLGSQGCQMLIDFGTGLVMDGVDENPRFINFIVITRVTLCMTSFSTSLGDTTTMTVMQ